MSTTMALADTLLDLLVEADPLEDTYQGYPRFGDQLGDPSKEADAERRRRALEIAAAARGIEDEDTITRALVVEQAESLVARVDARLIEHTVADYAVSPLGRLLIALPMVELGDEQAERDFLTRLAAVPAYLAKASDRHRLGAAGGRLPVAGRVRSAVARLDAYLADADGDPLRRPALAGGRDEEREGLLADVVRPAFAAYRDVLASEIAPHARPDERPGLCWLPGGEATYAALARVHTSTGRSPEALHRTGLELIEALAEEYVAIGSRLFGASTAGEVRERMRSDPELRWGGPEELLAAARSAIDRAEEAAPRWFGRLPSRRCALEPVPDAEAPDAPAAYYIPPALDGSRPGTYFANTHRATERDRFLSEAVAFHEAVPGHHFQMSLAQELADLPQLRRLAPINAYIEGWGLYTERLADEMGLYSGDVARLGMLAMDSMRAARLVVDTGLHAFGWSRDRVVAYLREHTVMAEVEIQSETDRYIEMPAQALSYMVGRLELERLRSEAEAALGAAFDIRAYHDLVLGSGPLPLSLLEGVVGSWIADQRP